MTEEKSPHEEQPPRRKIHLMGRSISLPRSRPLRIGIGTGFIMFGFLGFLPVLGFWMIPVGLLVLSHDVGWARRNRRRLAVWWERRQRRRDGANGRGS